MPFFIIKFLGEDIAESYTVFYHERLLAKFIEIPEIEIDINGQ